MDFPRTVYAIRHNKTNRVYIGSSKHPEVRIKSHMTALRGGFHIVEDMQSDFDLYGEDYTISFLEVITKYEDRFHEYDWMKLFNSHIRGTGYNYKDRYLQERKIDPKVEYRKSINALLRETDDVELLDLIFQILRKAANNERKN